MRESVRLHLGEHMNIRRSATLFAVLIIACTEAPKPSAPEVGYYPLVSVDGHALPSPVTPNGCPVSFTGGGANLTAQTFTIELDWTGSCPPSPPVSSAWRCSGVSPSTMSAEVELSGVYADVQCGFRVTGYGDRLAGRFVGADSSIWRDPHFELGPRQTAH